MKYKISRYAALHGVTYRTVWNWIGQGKLKTEKDDTGHTWIIDDAGVERTKTYAVYARVSSSENREKLDTQADQLVSFCNARGYKVSDACRMHPQDSSHPLRPDTYIAVCPSPTVLSPEPWSVPFPRLFP